MGPTVGPGSDQSELNEDDPAPRALQIISPSDQGEGSQNRSEFMWSGLPRPKWPDQVITNNYIPPRGPEPPRVEISALGEEEVKRILRRWEPFHRGESTTNQLNDLYPVMYRVPVAARGMGFHEAYIVPVLASTSKEYFLQIIDDGIQVRNRNFFSVYRVGKIGYSFEQFYLYYLSPLLLIGFFIIYHEFELRLRDAERLRLFVQAGMAEREMQIASLKQAELTCRCLELEARESVEKAARAEAERDTASHEAAMAKLTTEGALNTWAQIESELARVQNALALAEEARKAEFDHGIAQEAFAVMGEAYKKAEEENNHLAEEKLALVIELGAVKDEFSAFQEKVTADREMMEAAFDSSSDTLFNYGYGCCAFAHDIRGSKPKIPDDMPNPSVQLTADFFANPHYPPGSTAAASSLDPVVVGGEDRSVNSPSAVGKEAALPMEAVLSTDPPAE